ncbi:response regulator [Lachnotalea glycerini]|uniref:Stage 0 sporulation protein A homolog n=1 Tax=Lachnotalea glycerini TaxID=1763509 RepID=A0A371JJ93_9FIRM|nr:response regulator [Lachnotalea glycerini]RDY32799.1 response regulator [Lachnotalea glycerini]
MKKLMIVDDASFMRISIKKMLESKNYDIVAEAGNGAEAVEMYKLHNPDIVTMDITMPVMSGIEALREIKKINSNAKVVMVSAMGQEVLIKEAIISGATSFIVKPFQSEKLLEVLEGLTK